MAADLPGDILPFATGRKLYPIFGAEAAATGLEAMGKRQEGCLLYTSKRTRIEFSENDRKSYFYNTIDFPIRKERCV